MENCDVLIVGGGPGGSTCARRLVDAGVDVVVLDKAVFPRDKVCAGWITPAVLDELDLDPIEYQREGRVLQPISAFRVGRQGGPMLDLDYGSPVSFGIRRCEFDHYLLSRCGARLQLGESVRSIALDDDAWIVNDRYRASMLVGAGGHFCPVAQRLGSEPRARRGSPDPTEPPTEGLRTLKETSESREGEAPAEPEIAARLDGCVTVRQEPRPPRSTQGHSGRPSVPGSAGSGDPRTALICESVVAAQEIEFRLDDAQQAECRVDGRRPELYFCRDLAGYGWCFRKGDYLNVGLGREDRERLPEHVAAFCEDLQEQGRIPRHLSGKFRGHAYLLYGHSSRNPVGDRVVLIGDAAGLAYAESGEGIRPAIESGLMAAAVILAAAGDYGRERLEPYRALLRSRFGERRSSRPPAGRPWSRLRQFLAGRLLASRWFVRRVVIERWFLHGGQPPLESGE